MSLAIGEITSPVEGVGTVKFYFDSDNGRNNITLHNVMHSPKLRRNLMSGTALVKNGGTFVGGKEKIEIFNRNGRKLFYARKINGLYYFKPKYPKNIHIEKSNLTTSEEKDLELWHNRFCHINSKYILRSSQNESIRGISKLKSINVECEDCKIDSQEIEMERTNTYLPEMNGVSERFNYTPLDAIRAMLRGSGLSNKFWSEALLCFTYTWNRICHKNQTKTPFELYCGKKPLVKHLKTFGCKACWCSLTVKE
ncbi:copia protein [Trichonephila clavipes]|nr:copia protein [Trichonephila clavipes]